MSPNLKILKEGSYAEVSHLINSDSPPTPQELNEALTSVVWREDYELTKLLLDTGANPNIRPTAHMLPLLCAIEQLNKDLVELLIKYGADVNAGHEDLFTPLHLAVDAAADCAWQMGRTPNTEIIELLLSSGADPTIKTTSGETPLDIAQDYEFTAAIKLLSSH